MLSSDWLVRKTGVQMWIVLNDIEKANKGKTSEVIQKGKCGSLTIKNFQSICPTFQGLIFYDYLYSTPPPRLRPLPDI